MRLTNSNNVLSGMVLVMATVIFALNRMKSHLGTRARAAKTDAERTDQVNT